VDSMVSAAALLIIIGKIKYSLLFLNSFSRWRKGCYRI